VTLAATLPTAIELTRTALVVDDDDEARSTAATAIGPAGVAMAGAGKSGWGVPAKPAIERDEPSESGFDADAAIARYLASKQAVETAPVAAHVQAVARANPQRPVFGRRQTS